VTGGGGDLGSGSSWDCGCEMVHPGVVNESIEGKEDLIPNAGNLVDVGEVGVVSLLGGVVVILGGLSGVVTVVILLGLVFGVEAVATVSSLPDLLSSLCKRERGGVNLTSPPFVRADNRRWTLTPLPVTPVKFANGSSSSKKSGGGELRGEVMGRLKEVEFWRFEC
jgi:hypothetical protein